MKNQNLRLVIFFAIVILLSLLINSCSVKKDKSTAKEEVKLEQADKSKIDKSEEINSNIKVSETTTVNNQDQTTTVEETVEPIDTSKPATYTDKSGNKQELNNTKKTTKTTVKNNNTVTDSKKDSIATTQSSKKESEQKDLQNKAAAAKKASNLNVKKDSSISWSWLWVLLALVVYWLCSRYKSKIIAFKNSFF